MEEREVAERVRRVEALLEVADERAVELAGALLELYGEALSRVMATVSAVSARPAGSPAGSRLSRLGSWGGFGLGCLGFGGGGGARGAGGR